MGVTTAKLDLTISISRAWGATRLILFGSAIESPHEAKDIDLACEGIPGWEIFGLAAELERALQIPVDLIPLRPSSRFTRAVERKGKALM